MIVAEIGRLRPAALGLSEAGIGFGHGRWLQRALRRRHGLDYALHQVSEPGPVEEATGQALLTTLRVLETATMQFQDSPQVALVARLQLDRRVADLCITHLHGRLGDEYDELRERQAQQLLAWIGNREGADLRIVCGDFNAPRESEAAQLMAGRFHATQTAATAFTSLKGPGGAPTQRTLPRLDRCIDYIWVDGAISVEKSGLCFDVPSPDDPDLWPSDHLGVWADLDP